MRRFLAAAAVAALAVILGACAALQGREPVRVSLAGIEELPSEGLEMRMKVKLRVQNPDDRPLDYDGVSVSIDILGRTYASGVSDERGTVPRFGEAVIALPMSVPVLQAAANAIAALEKGPPERVTYRVQGRLHGPAFGSAAFDTQGEIPWPGPALAR